jgi:hypothetical protein
MPTSVIEPQARVLLVNHEKDNTNREHSVISKNILCFTVKADQVQNIFFHN